MGSIQPPDMTFVPGTIKRVCIIGAGPSGLSFAKYLKEEQAFDAIDIYESMSEVGGAWKYSPHISRSPLSAPQTDPHQPLEEPVWDENGVPEFPTPMYDTLRTNIPKTLMAYHDFPFSEDTPLFPSRQVVQDYLIRYSQDLREDIKFSSQIQDISLALGGDCGDDKWLVHIKDLRANTASTVSYDAVVVANGHYTVPHIPPVDGMQEFSKLYPDVIQHSKFYRSPEAFVGKKVIVVGNAASGSDIGSQIQKHSLQPMFWSIREPTDAFGHDERVELPPIAEYLPESRGVRFEDGRIESDVDAIVYCTGYLYSFPFMPSIKPPLVTNGSRVRGLYKQLFHISHPTLAFPLLAQKVLPFPMSEFQAAAVARLWSGRISLPSKAHMEEFTEAEVLAKGDGTGYHVLMPRDADYAQDLKSMIDAAEPKTDGQGRRIGKDVEMWDDKFLWTRENFGKIRLDYAKNVGVTTLEELGWDFEEHRKELVEKVKDL